MLAKEQLDLEETNLRATAMEDADYLALRHYWDTSKAVTVILDGEFSLQDIRKISSTLEKLNEVSNA